MYEHKVKWCPVCNQGWIEIVKDATTATLYCSCFECESEWNTPFEISKKNVNSENSYGLIETPTYDEIKMREWDKFILKE